MKLPNRIVWSLAGAALVVGCASTPPPALEVARNEYRAAAQDPHVPQYAPVALHEAEQALSRAEQAFAQDGKSDEVAHLAYLAEQRVDIARAQARKAMAQQQVDELAQQREQVLLDARGQQVRQERERARELERELEELKARQTERGTEVSFGGDVLFAFDRAELKPGAMRNLQPLVDYLRANAERNLLIEGHTDSTGSEEYNLRLSRERAAAVRNYLTAQGVAPERITIQGLGEAYPVAPNTNPAGQQANRRVDVVILEEGQSAQRMMR